VALAALLCLFAPPLGSIAVAEPAVDEPLDFDIPAQPISAALRAYARQANLQLLVLTDGLEAVQSNAVIGSFEAGDALRSLLDGTGLEAEHRPDSTVAVTRQTQPQVRGPESVPGDGHQLMSNQAIVQVGKQGAAERLRGNDTDTEETAAPPIKIEEIIVTGSQIRGTGPVGTQVITIDRTTIEISGLATTHEILRSVPQNFGGGPNEDTTSVGLGAGEANWGYASSVNLRGLGTDSTLLLLNGRRSAPGGGDGSFIDLNSVPVAAIERIEVLPDGASAIYGSDAIGGVINVILRDDYRGAESRVRYASDDGNDVDEVQFSQVLGTNWESGNLLVAYEYYDRNKLYSSDRAATADSDLSRFGGTNRSTGASNPGNITRYTLSDGTSLPTQLAIPRDQDGAALSPTDLIVGVTNLQNTREKTTVLPKQRRNSLFFTASQQLSKEIDLFADARFSSRTFESFASLSTFTQLTVPNTNPFFVDPFGESTALIIGYSYVDDYGAPRSTGEVESLSGTLGVRFPVSNSWEFEIYGSHSIEDTDRRNDRFPNSSRLATALSDSNPGTAFNPFGEGSNTNRATLAAIEGFIQIDHESKLSALNVRGDGEILSLPGGTAKLALGTAFREESLQRDQTVFNSSPSPLSTGFVLDRTLSAFFVELFLPIVSESNARLGFERLLLSLAARHEDYNDFGDTFDPKFGAVWSPAKSMAIRATIGTSFRAPLLAELDDQNRSIALIAAPDPASSVGITNTLFIFGNSAGLVPQDATTWTAGVDLMPTSAPGLEIGITYFDTEVENLIEIPGNNIFEPLQKEAVFAPIITRDPDTAAVNALLNDPAFNGTPIPPAEIGAIIDFRRQNLAKAQLSGVDLNVNYGFETQLGSFDVTLYGSHLLEFKEQLANGPMIDNIDTLTKPNSLKLRGSVGWVSGGFNATVTGNHIGDYEDRLSVPARPVSSWTTWDSQVAYAFQNPDSALLSGLKMSLSVWNIFDKDPPFVDGSNGVGFDAINADVLGRFAALQLAKTW
jgi:outer membrane receptor protein involved in Fe transport